MRKLICLILAGMFTVSEVFAAEQSSIMNFNDSVTHDEADVEWTPSGDPVLSSVQSISGGKSLYLDGNSYLQAKNTQPLTCPESSPLRRGYSPKNG